MNSTYLSILFQQFQSKQPTYSEQIISTARSNADLDRTDILNFLNQPNLREEHFIQWLDLSKDDFQNGMDTAFDMDRSGAEIKSARYILKTSTNNGLIFFHQQMPDFYIELCNQKRNPFWLFPLWEDFKETNSIKFINQLSPFLQGCFLYSLWNEYLQEDNNGNNNLEELLSLIHNQIKLQTMMVFLGKITEPLIRNSFDEKRPQQLEINKERLELILKWMVHKIGNIDLEEQTINVYLQHLQGRVNRESWLAALYFANRLEQLNQPIADKNARKIREMVTAAYPTIWVSNSNDHYYLSGKNSIVLLTELANALLKLYGTNAIETYWNHEAIFQVYKLWHLRNTHDYSTYISKRGIVFVHCFLLAKMIEQSKVSIDVVSEIHHYVCSIFQQASDHHIFTGEELVVEHLLETLGIIYETNNVLEQFVPELINRIIFPGYAVYLLKGLNRNSSTVESIVPLIEQKLNNELPLLRRQERMKLAFAMYRSGSWFACCKLMKTSNLTEQAINDRSENIILLYASAVLQSISNFESEGQKLEYVNDAYSNILSYQRKYPYSNTASLSILRGYLVRERYEGNEIGLATITNEYRTLSNSSPETSDTQDIATLAYVKLLLLVHLIHDHSTESTRTLFINDFNKLIDQISPLQGIESTKLLLQVWMKDLLGESNTNIHYEKVKVYEDELKVALPYLPKPIQEFSKKIFREAT